MAKDWRGRKTVCYSLRVAEDCLVSALAMAGDPATVEIKCAEAIAHIKEAVGMAKRMDAKLKQYHEDYAETFYPFIQSGE